MVDKHEKASNDENPHQQESGERFHFWLVAVALAIFIFLLFYSQKTHGIM